MAGPLGPRFTNLWLAAGISNLGDGVIAVAFPLLVASITRDPFAVAAATIVNRIPWFFFALVSGALVDRMDRRIVMMVTDALRAVIVGIVGILLLAGDVGLPLIYVVGFLLGVAETFFDTSAEAILPSLVDDERLPAANGRLQATEWVGNAFAGPPLGAVLFAVTAGLPFLFDAGTFVVAAVLVGLIAGSYRSEREGPAGTLRSDIGEGLGWLWRHTVLRTLSLMAGVTNMVAFGIIAVFVLFIQDEIGLGDVGYGLVISALGVGGLLGAIVSGAVVKRLGPGTTLLGSVALLMVNGLIMGVSSEVWVIAVITGSYGVAITAWNVVAVSLRQALTPDPLRGRVASVARLLAWGTQPIGALLGGVVAGAWGLRAPFFVAVGVWAGMLVLTAPIVNNRRIRELEARSPGS